MQILLPIVLAVLATVFTVGQGFVFGTILMWSGFLIAVIGFIIASFVERSKGLGSLIFSVGGIVNSFGILYCRIYCPRSTWA